MSHVEAIENTFGITEKKKQNVTRKETEILENGGGERGEELGHGERQIEGEQGRTTTRTGTAYNVVGTQVRFLQS